MSTTTLERSHSYSTTHSMASPRPSSQRDTPPSDAELSLLQMNDRMNQLDSRFLELRSLVLTKDGYVDRRNREDEHIRREFESHRAVSDRIDLNVVSLRSDVTALRSDVNTLRSDVTALRSDVTTLRFDVDRIDANLAALRSDMDRRIGNIENKLDSKDRTNFNYLARTIHAQIRPVPISAEDGSAIFPKWFPPTVWKFWCLKKRSRIHRLIELAEFYQLGDYQDWSRVHSANQAPYDSDGSDSSDAPMTVSRADAVRLYPEAAHQALGIHIGVAYHKLHIIVGAHSMLSRPTKRQQDDLGSNTSKSKSRPVKMTCRPNPAIPPPLQHLVPSVSASRSSKSEEHDKLEWKAFPDAPGDARSKHGSFGQMNVADLLRAVEEGRVRIKPSTSEKARMSPTGSRASHASRAADPVQAEVPTEPNTNLTRNTVPTEPMTSLSNEGPASGEDIPETASEEDSSAS